MYFTPDLPRGLQTGALGFLTLLTLSCSRPPEQDLPAPPVPPLAPVQVTLQQDTLSAGDVVAVTFHNPTDSRFEYGEGCMSILVRRKTDDDWRLVPPTPRPKFGAIQGCPAVGHLLEPGATKTMEVPLPPDLQEGTYRIRPHTHDPFQWMTPLFVVK